MFTLMYHRIKPTALPGLPRWLRLGFQWWRLRDTSEHGEASTTAADKRPHRRDPWQIASPSLFQRCLPFVSLIFFPPLTLPPFPVRTLAGLLFILKSQLLDHGSDPISQNLREVSIGHLLDGDLQGSSYAVTTLHAIASIVVVAGEVFFQEKFEGDSLDPTPQML
jgi:hypothetical protein